jgi:hypothetical protein
MPRQVPLRVTSGKASYRYASREVLLGPVEEASDLTSPRESSLHRREPIEALFLLISE